VKRLLLPQGELAQFYDSDDPVRYIAYVELRPGTVRGNHYHRIKEELVYLILGEIVLLVEEVDSKARESIRLKAGELAVIQPGIAHALRVVKAGHAVECSKTRFEATDSYRYPLS
jgi:quercetin dioxygenase-like cupin family protein